MISSSEVWLVPSNIANEKDLCISRKWKLVFFPSERDHTGLFAGLQTSPLVLWTVICIFTCSNLKLSFLLMHVLHATTLSIPGTFKTINRRPERLSRKPRLKPKTNGLAPRTSNVHPLLGYSLSSGRSSFPQVGRATGSPHWDTANPLQQGQAAEAAPALSC